ncbi:tetratricopeptide repeat protein [Candidatus Marinimicrobia bacterium]|nr:tetratricopeptide repeat protein [Candidatus Neomarinimicrobiota bacterium]
MNLKTKFIFILIIGAFLFGQNKASINASIKTAKMLERKGDVDGAIAIYEAILLTDPKNHRTIRDLKSLFKKNQKYDAGILFVRERLIHSPNDIQLYSELGEFHFLNDQQEEAQAVWTAGIEKFNNNQSYYRIMVSLYGRFSLDKELLNLLEKGRDNFGKSFMAYEAGIFYQTRRSYDKAMEQFILQLAYEPKKSGVIRQRILLMSDEDDAIDIIESTLQKASKEQPIIFLDLLSDFNFKQQKYENAFQSKLKRSNLGNPNFNEWLTFANELRKEAQYDLSIQSYNYILGKKINSNLAGKALLGIAKTFEDQIIPANESHLIPYFFDNNLFFEDPFQVNSSISPKHLESSIALYDSLLISLPKSSLLADAYFRLGEIQFRILHDFDKAYSLLAKAMKNKPDKKLKLKLILRITDVLMAKGQSDQALQFLDREMKRYSIPAIEQKKILVHFLSDDPDSTLKKVQSTFLTMNPIDPSFNDLMELKNILTQYYENEPNSKEAFSHFIKAEWYLRQRKIGDAIRELDFLVQLDSSSTIVPLANLRQGLLHYQLKDFDKALSLALSLDGSPLADRGIILAGQIYESKLLDPEKALEQYMRILDEFPTSIFSEPIRYHIRSLQNTES